MKPRFALALVPLAMLTACGDSAGKVYTINSGTYTTSSVSAVQPDDCNLATLLPDGTLLGVEVVNGTATFRIGNEVPDPARNPISTINGNTIQESPAKAYDSPSSSVPACIEQITVSLSGEILKDDQFSGTLKYQADAKPGNTACTKEILQYKTLPCASTVTFLARKQ